MPHPLKDNATARARSTGETFRQLLRALVAASEGSNIIYLTLRPALKKWYCDQAMRIARSYLPADRVTRLDNTIRIKGAGSIRFMHVDEEQGGLKGEFTFDD